LAVLSGNASLIATFSSLVIYAQMQQQAIFIGKMREDSTSGSAAAKQEVDEPLQFALNL